MAATESGCPGRVWHLPRSLKSPETLQMIDTLERLLGRRVTTGTDESEALEGTGGGHLIDLGTGGEATTMSTGGLTQHTGCRHVPRLQSGTENIVVTTPADDNFLGRQVL